MPEQHRVVVSPTGSAWNLSVGPPLSLGTGHARRAARPRMQYLARLTRIKRTATIVLDLYSPYLDEEELGLYLSGDPAWEDEE